MHQSMLPDMKYYVTVVDAGRVGFLLGPYDTLEEAETNVSRGRELACQANQWAHFYAFGCASLPEEKQPKTVFGR